MNTQLNNSPANYLPIRRDLTIDYAISMIVAILLTGVSIGGLVFPSNLYPTDELVQSYMANDVLNLFIGLPILLGSMWFTRRGKLVGLLFWPGALVYILYNYVGYLFGIPFNFITLVYLALVLLSAYGLFDLLKNIDQNPVGERLAEVVPVKIGGWTLILFGVAFIIRAVGMLIPAVTSQAVLPISEVGVLIADLVLSTLWIAGGVMLLRRMPLGYVSGLGLLFAGVMLFIGLILFILLQPLLTAVPFVPGDVLVVSLMGLVCSIPFGLYLRAVLSKG